ncbi:DUF4922 domain-containing protein [Limibacterium fermenti]|uniref:DUF4922 domain-containing protein n=1 Tax=Limibacterium fermenti TaxID=3229863 RepID=UPI000E9067B6|nr:DUF4922 domain-containing protein [Porphyromonadaceae bacterium]
MDFQEHINQLFIAQKKEWKQLRTGLEQLDNNKIKEFAWGDVSVTVQFNPSRIRSAAAKVDTENIEKRPCFLCAENRPKEQRGIPFLDKYIVLCNPYPILRNHLTIPLHSHVPQRIRKKIGDMLTLSELLPDYIVFYNGPKCGASAPDHFHLQAGLKEPVLIQGDNELRSCLTIETENKKEAEDRFEDVYQYLHTRQPDEEEPMMNIIAYRERNRYILNIYPRRAHRPKQYDEEGNKSLLISPGALDMAGLIITVREEDFNKIQSQDIEDIYSQVSMPII